jgi:predicted methyltransferase
MNGRLALGLGLFLLCSCDKGDSTAPPDAVPITPAKQEQPESETGDGTPAMGPNFRAYEVTEEAKKVVAAEDRSADDLEDDARRRPAELLSFAEIAAGQKIADLGAGGGYTTELLVRAVGPEGTVYAQNDKFALENFSKESWPARLAKPINAKVVRVDREFSDPLPAEATDLDRVTIIFSYHDAVVRGQDTKAMNAKVFEHLKPGGMYIILDHSAKPGTGTSDTEKFHRIDEQTVIEEVEAAGFELVETGDFLRDPADTRDWEVWKRGFATDRFALKFQKPAG